MLHPIDKGQLGWKKRKIEIKIMDVLSRATTPQTGWCVFQKLRKKYANVNGEIICQRRNSLCERGYLERVGYYDEDSQYVLAE